LGCDADHPQRIAAFWALALGYVKESGFDEPDNASIVDLDGRGPAISFLKVPEGKAAEPRTGRRMHIDVMPTDGTRDEEVVRLKGLGRDPSTRIIASPNGAGWVTRADPEGNLFCVERSQEHHGPRQSSR